MPSTDRDQLLAQVSSEYYLDNQSKVHIAEKYDISRFQVARLLDEARAEGIVRIQITFPNTITPAEQAELAARLGVQKVVVVRQLSDEVQQRDALAQAVAGEISQRLSPGMTLGVSWSRTLDVAARYIKELPVDCEVVQLAGALPGNGSLNPIQMMQRLTRRARGKVLPLWAPLVVDSARTAAELRQQPEIFTALRKADHLDLAAVSIGGWGPGLSTVWDRVDQRLRRAAADAGAVAEISGRLLDPEGDEVATELDEKVLAVTMDQLRAAGTVIAAAQGRRRASAVLAATSSAVVDVLVIDQDLAAALRDHF